MGRVGCLSLLFIKSIARQIVVSVGSGWLLVCVEVVFPSLGWPFLFPVPFLFFLFGGFRWIPVGGQLCSAIFVDPCLLPVKPALPEDPRRDSVHCQLVVSFVRSSSTNGSSSPSGSSFEISSKEGLLSASWLLSSCSLRSWWLGSVVSFSGSLAGSWGSPSAVSSTRSRRVRLKCDHPHHLFFF